MRKILFAITIAILLGSKIISINAQPISTNGKCFTAKGDLKVLLVAIKFSDSVNAAMPIDANIWHKDSAFPKEITDNKVFYTDYKYFDSAINTVRAISNTF